MSTEVKVVIVLKDARATIGVKSPDCDPLLAAVEGGLEQALARVPALVQEAQAKWSLTPRNPRSDIATPPPGPAASRVSTPVRTSTTKTAPAKTESAVQKPNLF